MISGRNVVAFVMAATALCSGVFARVNDDAAAVLKSSAGAITQLKGFSYKSKLYGLGALKDFMDGEGALATTAYAVACMKVVGVRHNLRKF